MNHFSIGAMKRYPRVMGRVRRALWLSLVLALTLTLTVRPAAADCGGGGGVLAAAATFFGGPGVGTFFGAGAAADCAADQAKEVIETAGREAQEVVVAAGNQATQVVRVAGYEAEQVVETIGDEAAEVIMVGSNEAQEVIGVAGETANDVLHTAGMEGQALIGSLGSEAEHVMLIASREAQAVAHVAGAEARATAAAMGAEFREVVMLVSNESMTLTRLAGEEARQVVRVAGEEARLTLDHFQANNERLLQQISKTYQGNLDITIDSLDEGSRRMMLNYYNSMVEVNRILTHDVMLVEASSRSVIAAAGDEADAVASHLEASMANLILVAGETSVYVIDRTTNNVITVMAIILTGLGLLLLIYLFFVHQMPVGKSARFVYGFMVVYLVGFGLLILSPTARVYAMRSAQVGLRAELEKSTDPQVILYRVVTQGTSDDGARIEINGRHLLAGEGRPATTLDGRPLAMGIASDESLTFPLDAATTARLRERALRLVIDFGRPELLVSLDVSIINPRDTVEPFNPQPETVALSAIVGAAVTVYGGPAETLYVALGVLEADTRYPVIGRNSERTWWAIVWDGGQGWVAGPLVSVIGSVLSVPIIDPVGPTVTPTATPTSAATSTPSATPTLPPTATPSPTPCVWAVTAKVNANIRSGPGELSYDVIGTLPHGQTAAVIGRSPDDAWSVIDHNGRQGWVSDKVVVINRCPTRPPTVPPPPTPTPLPTATATATRLPTVTDLLGLAQQGAWKSGQLLSDGHSTARDTSLRFGGSGSSGSVSLGVRDLEDGTSRYALRTHPMWVDNGTIKGWLPAMVLPPNAVFETEIGFMNGARATDGATFWVWMHYQVDGRPVRQVIAQVTKRYDGRLIPLRIDLSPLAGQTVMFELRVDAGPSSGQDWAAWVAPRISGN